MKTSPRLVSADYLAPSERRAFTMTVPSHLVARVNAALVREGLDVTQSRMFEVEVVEGTAPAGVPALLSGSGPRLPKGWLTP